MRLMDAFSWQNGSSPGLVSLGSVEQTQVLAALQAPPRDPRALVGSQTPEGSCGVRLSQLGSQPLAGLPAACWDLPGTLLWLHRLGAWQELPFALWGLSKVQQ